MEAAAAPARPPMAPTPSLDLGKIVPPAGFLLHRRAAVPSTPVLWGRSASGRGGLAVLVSSSNDAAGLSPQSDSGKKGPVVMEIPLEDTRRPLVRTCANDPDKVQELMILTRPLALCHRPPKTGWSSAGAVARDHRGSVLISICKTLPTCSSVEEVEARAVLSGMLALADVYKGPIVLEMDCQSIAKDLAAHVPTRSPCYGVILDIKRAMIVFASCSLNCIRRSGNALAHELAAETRRNGDLVVIAGVPDRLRSLMLNECIGLV